MQRLWDVVSFDLSWTPTMDIEKTLNEHDWKLERVLALMTSAISADDMWTFENCLARWESLSESFLTYQLQPVLFRAMQEQKFEAASLLLQRGIRSTCQGVWAAVSLRAIPMLELYLRHGWDINRRWGEIWHKLGIQ